MCVVLIDRERLLICDDSDLVPTGSGSSIEKEDIPKSMIRVLNAAKIREEYRRKRKQGEGSLDPDGRPSKRQKTHVEEKPRGKDGKGALIIKVCCDNLEATANPDLHLQPGETLGQFNRYVRLHRPLICTVLTSYIVKASRGGHAHPNQGGEATWGRAGSLATKAIKHRYTTCFKRYRFSEAVARSHSPKETRI